MAYIIHVGPCERDLFLSQEKLEAKKPKISCCHLMLQAGGTYWVTQKSQSCFQKRPLGEIQRIGCRVHRQFAFHTCTRQREVPCTDGITTATHWCRLLSPTPLFYACVTALLQRDVCFLLVLMWDSPGFLGTLFEEARRTFADICVHTSNCSLQMWHSF